MYKNDFDFPDLLIGFSIVAVVFAVVGAAVADLYLASTQWMLVASVLALWGIYWENRKSK